MKKPKFEFEKGTQKDNWIFVLIPFIAFGKDDGVFGIYFSWLFFMAKLTF